MHVHAALEVDGGLEEAVFGKALGVPDHAGVEHFDLRLDAVLDVGRAQFLQEERRVEEDALVEVHGAGVEGAHIGLEDGVRKDALVVAEPEAAGGGHVDDEAGAALADQGDRLLEPIEGHGGLVILGADVDVGDGGAGFIARLHFVGDLLGLGRQTSTSRIRHSPPMGLGMLADPHRRNNNNPKAESGLYFVSGS